MMQLLAALDSPTGRLTEGVAEAASGAEASSGLGGSLLSGSGLNSASVSSLRGMLRSFSSTGSLEGMSAANLGEGQLIDLQNFAALARNNSLQNALGSMSNNSSFNFGSLGGAVAGAGAPAAASGGSGGGGMMAPPTQWPMAGSASGAAVSPGTGRTPMGGEGTSDAAGDSSADRQGASGERQGGGLLHESPSMTSLVEMVRSSSATSLMELMHSYSATNLAGLGSSTNLAALGNTKGEGEQD